MVEANGSIRITTREVYDEVRALHDDVLWLKDHFEDVPARLGSLEKDMQETKPLAQRVPDLEKDMQVVKPLANEVPAIKTTIEGMKSKLAWFAGTAAAGAAVIVILVQLFLEHVIR